MRLFDRDAPEEHKFEIPGLLYFAVNNTTKTVIVIEQIEEANKELLTAFEDHLKKQGYFLFSLVVPTPPLSEPSLTEKAFERLSG